MMREGARNTKEVYVLFRAQSDLTAGSFEVSMVNLLDISLQVIMEKHILYDLQVILISSLPLDSMPSIRTITRVLRGPYSANEVTWRRWHPDPDPIDLAKQDFTAIGASDACVTDTLAGVGCSTRCACQEACLPLICCLPCWGMPVSLDSITNPRVAVSHSRACPAEVLTGSRIQLHGTPTGWVISLTPGMSIFGILSYHLESFAVTINLYLDEFLIRLQEEALQR